jgi:hypothetical protein
MKFVPTAPSSKYFQVLGMIMTLEEPLLQVAVTLSESKWRKDWAVLWTKYLCSLQNSYGEPSSQI